MGFFWGDGSIKSGVRLNVAFKDGRVLNKLFKTFLNFSYKEIVPSQKGVIYRQNQSIFSRFPKELLFFLKENDYENKSYVAPTKILKLVNHKYFWQGLVDADGCFCKAKDHSGGRFSISSTIDQDWTEVEKWLKSLGVKTYKIYKKDYTNGKSSSVEVRYGEDVRKIGKYLYGEKIIGLKRKFNKFKSIERTLPEITSSTKGVSFCKIQKRWRAYRKRIHLGWFKTEEEAVARLEEYLNIIN